VMRCDEFDAYAARWLEGERAPEAAGHLQDCNRCSARMADLELIVSTAAALPGLEPPECVWTSLRAQLEAEGLLRSRKSLRERWLEFFPTRPRTAVATALIFALAAGLLIVPPSPAPGTGRNTADGSFLRLSHVHDQLASAEASANLGLHLRDPEVAASYQQNLALVDSLIGECQQKVNEDPNDDMARQYLVTAYQQKADLLSALSERDTMGD
jgi:hypothetical protein